jgi:hypothetical protein
VSPEPHASDPYAELAELAELERDLAIGGRIDELLEVQVRRAALVAGLPARAPQSARPQLERAAAAQAAVQAALVASLAGMRGEIVRLEQGRTALSAYRPAGLAPAPRVVRAG